MLLFSFLVSFFMAFLAKKTALHNKHSVKSVRIRSYSGPHFPAFGLMTERYGVSLFTQWNIWFNFVFASYFEQDHLLNLVILGINAKWPKCAPISKQKPMWSKIWSMIFYNFDCQRTFLQDLSIGKILS